MTSGGGARCVAMEGAPLTAIFVCLTRKRRQATPTISSHDSLSAFGLCSSAPEELQRACGFTLTVKPSAAVSSAAICFAGVRIEPWILIPIIKVDISFPSATLSLMSLGLEGHVLGSRAKWKRLLQIPGLRNEVTQKEILYEHSVVCLGLSGSLKPCAKC